MASRILKCLEISKLFFKFCCVFQIQNFFEFFEYDTSVLRFLIFLYAPTLERKLSVKCFYFDKYFRGQSTSILKLPTRDFSTTCNFLKCWSGRSFKRRKLIAFVSDSDVKYKGLLVGSDLEGDVPIFRLCYVFSSQFLRVQSTYLPNFALVELCYYLSSLYFPGV